MSINRVVISGNLTREPELRMAGSTPLLQLGIAVNERRKNASTGEWEDVPNFFDVLVWGQRGESLSRFLKKGSKIAVSGKLRWSQWTNNEGQKRSKVEIVADEVDLLSAREGGGYSAPAPASAPADSGSDDVFTEDIPFF